MTEKQKRDAGLLYNPNNDKELMLEILSCKEKCDKYNKLPITELEARAELVKEIVSVQTQDATILPSFWCDYGYNIELGKNFFANHNLVILDCAKVKFGDNCFLGPNCNFYTAGHPLSVSQRNSGFEHAKPITVGNNVWIGGGVTVLPGVTIGDNTIIGAGSVVTQNIPSGVIAMGNPCKVHRKLTEDEMK